MRASSDGGDADVPAVRLESKNCSSWIEPMREPAWAAARVVTCAVLPPARCAACPGWPGLLPLALPRGLPRGLSEFPRPRPGAPAAGGDPCSMIGIPEVSDRAGPVSIRPAT